MGYGDLNMNILIATIKSWNIKNAKQFKKKYSDSHHICIIENRNDLNYEKVKRMNPDFIFFPHWSWLVDREIYENFNCIVFHMTDLPFGRGGSPLQNLIDLGVNKTKISAIKIDGGIDTGDIYLKEDLELNGTADEIFMRTSKIIFVKMIPAILENNIVPYKQMGNVVSFNRRNPEQSELKKEFSLDRIYDYIRMLDGEGYPKSFIKFGKYRLEFSRASLKHGRIVADVEIIDEGDEI
jgi:methionyl-tRNA formyltransferase